jgi:2-phosphoglycerate kinase
MSENPIKKFRKPSSIKVRGSKGQMPFSTGYLADTLIKIGISDDEAFEHAEAISKDILNNIKKKEVSSEDIVKFSIEWYETHYPKYADRLRIVANNFKDHKPIIILLGGVTGIGKSTIASQIAKRLDIRSIMGSDLIREVMRLVISSKLMPTLHTSSYIAFKELSDNVLPTRSPIILGFEDQARKVVTGIEAAITQAIKDVDFMIIEGVHLVPGLIRKALLSSANIIQLFIYLENEEEHMSRLVRREKLAIRGTVYSNYFKEIREIQDYLISMADRFKVPKIEVQNTDEAILKILDQVWDQLVLKSERFSVFY